MIETISKSSFYTRMKQNKAKKLSSNGKYEEAAKELEKIPNKDPDDLNGLGGLYFQIKEYETALVYFKKYLETGIDVENAYVNLGCAYGCLDEKE
ncbi:hypothetical protein WAK64_16990 [Bacillus spongiae]|uniref:Tetratricopeptide repeat protein n=1 Tax=Bacillus spongiae TaxID=2683610 RepID=A0ABU8HHA4_9BACI